MQITPDSRRMASERAEVLAELRAIRRELTALRRLLDMFAGVYLNAKFPFGKPVDQWRPRG